MISINNYLTGVVVALTGESLLEERTFDRDDVDRQCTPSIRDADEWLRVNPLDAPILNKHKNRLIHILGRASDVDIRLDRSVKAGGVLVNWFRRYRRAA